MAAQAALLLMCLRCNADDHDACEAKHGAITPCGCACNGKGTFIEQVNRALRSAHVPTD